MNVFLPDINVLIALFDPSHINHNEAHSWFGGNRKRGWATCPITVNGFVRVLSNPAYPSFAATLPEVVSHLRALCAAPEHVFWSDQVSLLDERLFRTGIIKGHRQITDVYLLGLAVAKGGILVTFDRSIPLKAVVNADAKNLHLLGHMPDS